MTDKFLGLNYIWWLVASMPFYAVGEYCSKLFANTHQWWYIVIGTIAYAVGSLCWFPSLYLRNELLVVDTIWKAFAVMSTAVVALFVFHERPTMIQYVGVAFVVIGMFLVK
jgi:uncharacterized membrane protein